jgi:hypothetical protein
MEVEESSAPAPAPPVLALAQHQHQHQNQSQQWPMTPALHQQAQPQVPQPLLTYKPSPGLSSLRSSGGGAGLALAATTGPGLALSTIPATIPTATATASDASRAMPSVATPPTATVSGSPFLALAPAPAPAQIGTSRASGYVAAPVATSGQLRQQQRQNVNRVWDPQQRAAQSPALAQAQDQGQAKPRPIFGPGAAPSMHGTSPSAPPPPAPRAGFSKSATAGAPVRDDRGKTGNGAAMGLAPGSPSTLTSSAPPPAETNRALRRAVIPASGPAPGQTVESPAGPPLTGTDSSLTLGSRDNLSMPSGSRMSAGRASPRSGGGAAAKEGGAGYSATGSRPGEPVQEETPAPGPGAEPSSSQGAVKNRGAPPAQEPRLALAPDAIDLLPPPPDYVRFRGPSGYGIRLASLAQRRASLTALAAAGQQPQQPSRTARALAPSAGPSPTFIAAMGSAPAPASSGSNGTSTVTTAFGAQGVAAVQGQAALSLLDTTGEAPPAPRSPSMKQGKRPLRDVAPEENSEQESIGTVTLPVLTGQLTGQQTGAADMTSLDNFAPSQRKEQQQPQQRQQVSQHPQSQLQQLLQLQQQQRQQGLLLLQPPKGAPVQPSGRGAIATEPSTPSSSALPLSLGPPPAEAKAASGSAPSAAQAPAPAPAGDPVAASAPKGIRSSEATGPPDQSPVSPGFQERQARGPAAKSRGATARGRGLATGGGMNASLGLGFPTRPKFGEGVRAEWRKPAQTSAPARGKTVSNQPNSTGGEGGSGFDGISLAEIRRRREARAQAGTVGGGSLTRSEDGDAIPLAPANSSSPVTSSTSRAPSTQAASHADTAGSSLAPAPAPVDSEEKPSVEPTLGGTKAGEGEAATTGSQVLEPATAASGEGKKRARADDARPDEQEQSDEALAKRTRSNVEGEGQGGVDAPASGTRKRPRGDGDEADRALSGQKARVGDAGTGAASQNSGTAAAGPDGGAAPQPAPPADGDLRANAVLPRPPVPLQPQALGPAPVPPPQPQALSQPQGPDAAAVQFPAQAQALPPPSSPMSVSLISAAAYGLGRVLAVVKFLKNRNNAIDWGLVLQDARDRHVSKEAYKILKHASSKK